MKTVGTTSSAAHALVGVQLADGWQVTSKLQRSASATGGFFSVGYEVEREGQRAFLKAIDLSRALRAPDMIRELKRLVDAFHFERGILQRCRGMSRVATPLTDGDVRVPGFAAPLDRVVYLVFDLADGDSRGELDAMRKFDIAWALRTMHQVAVGVRQLHMAGIAHQDLKPSNVLCYTTGAKVADLGRCSLKDEPGPYDKLRIAGDRTYAPPEMIYGGAPSDFRGRQAADLYHLGSLLFFFFTSTVLTAYVQARLRRSIPGGAVCSLNQMLAYFRHASNEAVERFRQEAAVVAPKLADDLSTILHQLVEPDPALRGHPIEREPARKSDPYSIERYVSSFDILARKAELELA